MKRDKTGKFTQAWQGEPKQAVKLSLTNTAWQLLEQQAKDLGISRSEVVEQYARHNRQLQHQVETQTNERQWLEAVLDLLPTPLILVDPEQFRVTFSNRAANAIAGVDLVKDVGATYNADYHCTDLAGQIIPPDQTPAVRAARGEKFVGTEICWHTPVDDFPLLVYADTLPAMHDRSRISVVVFQDIRERKQIEERLKESQRFIQQIADATPGILYIYDLVEQRNIYVNRQIGEVLGYTANEVQAMGNGLFPTLMHPEDLASLPAHLERLDRAQDGEVIEREYRMCHANGEWRWLWSRDLVFSRTSSGAPQQVLGIAHDITVRKHAECRRDTQYTIVQILAEATTVPQALSAILQALCEKLGWSVAMIWSVNHQTNCLTYTDSWRSLTAPAQALIEASSQMVVAPSAGLLGRVWMSRQPLWIANLHQDNDFLRVAEAAQAGLQSVFGFPILLGHQVLGVIECFCGQLQEPDQDLLKMMAAIGSQIGQFMERKRVEASLQESHELFQSFMNHSPIAAFIKDEAGRYVYANPRLERMFQKSQSELIGNTDFALLPDATAEQLWANDRAVLTRGQPMQMLETLQEEDGKHTYTVFKFPFRNAADQQVVAGVAIDVSERIQAEQALRESEEWARLAIQVARLGGWRLHLDTNRVEMDERMREIWGEPEDAVMIPLPKVIERIHPDDRSRVTHAVNAAIEPHSTGTYEIEYRIVWDDGTERWVFAKGQAQFDGEDESRRTVDFFGTLLDITDRKRVEAALAESNQTLQAIIQACPLAIVGLRADGMVRIWNPAAEQIFGWSQQDVLGQFFPAIPDDKQHEFLHNLAATTYKQGLVGVETQRQKKGNIRFDVELWTAPLDEAQAGISCLSVVADITARKQTEAALRLNEERLHSFVTANVIGILFGDLEGGIQEANDEFLRIVGYSREDLQAGTLRWVDITPPEYLPLDAAAIVEARQRRACTPYEKEYIRKDGSRVPVLVGFGLVLAVREEAVAFILDLSDRKQVEAEREQLLKREQTAREQAEAANRVKDEFLAVLSHELRTPLNPILGWTKLLRARQFDAVAADRALETIERNAKLQAQLIEDLLDVSRILQGKVRLEACPVNLATTIAAALETVRLSAEAKGIQIQTVVDAEGNPIVNGDANRLQQVVWNLLSNAIKFTPVGGRVEVRLSQVGAYAQIQVSDTGRGITPEFLPHVFEYFRQADSSTTRQFGGLGLGLAIVHHLVELHGGTVTVESPGLDLGATFIVQLPLLVSPLTPDLAALPVPATPHLQGIRILVVDDEADMRDLVHFILVEQGATVRVAASAAEALQQFTESMPDILISDIGMPEMDGYALMRQIRALLSAQGKMMSAIALTAYAGELNQQQALAAGFQMHLAKPVEPEALVRAIASLLKILTGSAG